MQRSLACFVGSNFGSACEVSLLSGKGAAISRSNYALGIDIFRPFIGPIHKKLVPVPPSSQGGRRVSVLNTTASRTSDLCEMVRDADLLRLVVS
jgi:hypothetical protein